MGKHSRLVRRTGEGRYQKNPGSDQPYLHVCKCTKEYHMCSLSSQVLASSFLAPLPPYGT